MTKYLQIANDKVVGAGECRGYQEGQISYPITLVRVTDEIFNAYLEDSRKVIYTAALNEVILNPDYEKIIAEEEAERVAHLSVTKSDFFDATIKAFGLDDNDLLPIITEIINKAAVSDVEKKIALNNFKNAKDFYRNHELFYVIQDKPLEIAEGIEILITAKQFDNFFKAVNEGNKENAYRELLPKD